MTYSVLDPKDNLLAVDDATGELHVGKRDGDGVFTSTKKIILATGAEINLGNIGLLNAAEAEIDLPAALDANSHFKVGLNAADPGAAAIIAPLGATTDAPVGDNTTAESGTARTHTSLLKRIVNAIIAVLAKLPAVGTAGTASANVITVQGVASMTPVLATGTGAAGTAATGVATVQGIASMTPLVVKGGGTAGTADSAVVTVQGIASGTTLPVTATPADLVEKVPTCFAKEVAVAGTAVALAAASTFARGTVLIRAAKAGGANTGNVYLGDSTVDKTTPQFFTLVPGEQFQIPIADGTKIDLNDLYIDCATGNTDGAIVMYQPA